MVLLIFIRHVSVPGRRANLILLLLRLRRRRRVRDCVSESIYRSGLLLSVESSDKRFVSQLPLEKASACWQCTKRDAVKYRLVRVCVCVCVSVNALVSPLPPVGPEATTQQQKYQILLIIKKIKKKT